MDWVSIVSLYDFNTEGWIAVRTASLHKTISLINPEVLFWNMYRSTIKEEPINTHSHEKIAIS